MRASSGHVSWARELGAHSLELSVEDRPCQLMVVIFVQMLAINTGHIVPHNVRVLVHAMCDTCVCVCGRARARGHVG